MADFTSQFLEGKKSILDIKGGVADIKRVVPPATLEENIKSFLEKKKNETIIKDDTLHIIPSVKMDVSETTPIVDTESVQQLKSFGKSLLEEGVSYLVEKAPVISPIIKTIAGVKAETSLFQSAKKAFTGISEADVEKRKEQIDAYNKMIAEGKSETWAKTTAFSPFYMSEKTAKEAIDAMTWIIGGVESNITKKFIKEIAKTTEEKSMLSLLKGAGFKSDVAKKMTPDLVKITDETGVKSYLDNALKEVMGLKAVVPETEKITNAAIKVEGKVYEAVSHDEALAKAVAEGKDISKIDKASEGMFKTSTGRLITRDQAQAEFGISKSADIPKAIIKEVGPAEQIAKANEAAAKIVQQDFNFMQKLDLPPEQISNLENQARALGLGERKVQTFADVKQMAQELLTDPQTLLKTNAKNLINSKEVNALNTLISNNIKFIVKSESEISRNPALEKTLRKDIETTQSQVNQALNKIIKGGTEAGRTLSAFRIEAQTTLDSAYWIIKARRIAKKDLTPEVQAAIMNQIDNKNIEGLARIMSSLENRTWTEKTIALWKAGLLTSPTTDMANVLGTGSLQLLETIKDIPAVGFDALFSLRTGKRAVTTSPKIIFEKIKGGLYGLSSSAKSALEGLSSKLEQIPEASGTKGVAEKLKYLTDKAANKIELDKLVSQLGLDNIYNRALLGKFEQPKVVFENKLLQGYLDTVFGRLSLEDRPFRQAAFSESMLKDATLIAKNEGLKGIKAETRISALLKEPENSMIMNAIDAAEFQTLNNPNAIADMISAAKYAAAAKSQFLYAAEEIVVPFSKVPSNVALRIVDYSPFGFVKAVFQQYPPGTEGQKVLAETLGRAVTGTGIIGLGYYLASKGLATGNTPTNEKERDMFFAEGKQGNSIAMNGEWKQLNRVSPIGNLMTLGAEIYNMSHQKEMGLLDISKSAGFAAMKTVGDQSFLKGASSAIKAYNDPERFAGDFFENTIGSIVPSIMYRTDKLFDPYLRISDTAIESIEKRIPGLSEKVPVKRNIWGDKVVTPGGKTAIIDPFSSSAIVDDPIINEMKRIGTTIGLANNIVAGEKLDNREFSEYQKYYGTMLKYQLGKFINSDNYKTIPEIDKVRAINQVVDEVKKWADYTVFPKLMAEKYNLDKDNTNPMVLFEVINGYNNNKDFQIKSDDYKKKAVKYYIELYNKENE